MSANSRLTVAAHVLAWMELNRRLGRDVVTSHQIAESVNTNPVVIRRSLADLRKAGLVDSRRGPGAGWSLLGDPEKITLFDVYQAVEAGPVLGMHHTLPNQSCPVGFGIQPALQSVYEGLERAVRAQLEQTTIADVLTDVLAQQSRPGAPGVTHTDLTSQP